MLTRTTQSYDRSGGVPDLICSLYHLLHYTHEDGTPFELSLRSRLHMIMDIACALQHLSSKAFLHLDLASFNVLVWRGEEGGVVRCKLADFSFAINQHSVSSRKKTEQRVVAHLARGVESARARVRRPLKAM